MAKCGYRTGVIHDAARSNWQNTGTRPIAWSAWYPTQNEGCGVPVSEPFFALGDVIRDANLSTREELPVVLLSHGTGGTAESLGWLARALASDGFVVIGANHHGNTGLESYFAEGFLCWWERAADLSVLLTSLGTSGFFANSLDFDRVSAAGFSLGGHTILALSGAQTSLDEFDQWRSANMITQGGPKEFPDAADHIPTLIETSQAFRHSWARHGDDFTDTRINPCAVIAPAPPIRSFTPQSIAQVGVPMTILTGGADPESPSVHCADWLVKQNKGFQHHDLGRNVGHYTFLEYPSDAPLIGQLDVFSDHVSVDRMKVHEQATKIIRETLMREVR
ncbi:dienelactone hydrolase [Sulfitobacter sp. SK012]|uniref:alpha/beta hydrolase family protein n=1 Tax=Sulfitobacter sp. SK012 TaxID=1389005 RepID=UPI000E0B424A|nr:dienelactone hydrolase [Sulfitobacter sp. SK012]AXI47161.1 dienelactone hydrolase [Sulfitobacter sp. SK012]